MSGPNAPFGRLGYPRDGRRGPAATMVEFAQPLLDVAGNDPEQMNKALQLGMLFWNVTIVAESVGEAAAREQLSEMETELSSSVEDCRAFRGMARILFERHASMRAGARVDMLRLLADLWGPDLSKGMPELGWRHRIKRTAKRWLTKDKNQNDEKAISMKPKILKSVEKNMFDVDEHEVRVLKNLGGDDVSVSDQSLKRYLEHLNQNVQLPCLLTGGEDFDWEEYYVFGPGDEEEYKELKKTRPSYRDTFELLSFGSWQDRGILVDVQRSSDKKHFTLPLADLKVIDKQSGNHQMIEDYAVWFVNY